MLVRQTVSAPSWPGGVVGVTLARAAAHRFNLVEKGRGVASGTTGQLDDTLVGRYLAVCAGACLLRCTTAAGCLPGWSSANFPTRVVRIMDSPPGRAADAVCRTHP